MGMYICIKCDNYRSSDDGCEDAREHGFTEDGLVCVDCVNKMEEGTDKSIPDQNELFRALMDLAMCSDPWPVEDEGLNQNKIIDYLEWTAKNKGYDGWIDAYHRFIE